MNPSELHSIEALNQANSSEHLSEREKHLLGLAVTLTRGCAYCSGGRLEKALAFGIPQETLNATVDLTAAVNAGVVVRTALLGIEGNEKDESARTALPAEVEPDTFSTLEKMKAWFPNPTLASKISFDFTSRAISLMLIFLGTGP